MFKQSLKYLAISTIILSRTFPTIASCHDEVEPGTQNQLKPEFTIIEEIKKPSYSYSNNYDARISADGSTIVGNIDHKNFYWTKEKGRESFTFTNQLSNTTTKGSNILSVNFDGTIFLAGFDLNSSTSPLANPHVIKRDIANNSFKISKPDILDPKSNGSGGIRAMSGDGSTLVGYDHYSDNGGRANPYTWKEGVGKKILERLNKGLIGIAYGANYDGSVVVGYCSDHENNGDKRATVWINGVIKSLGLLPPQEIKKSRTHKCYSDSLAFATNFDGSVTVGWCHDKEQKFYTAFVHSPEMGMESLGASQDGKFGSSARAINWNGNVIVGQSSLNGNDRMATIWIRELETRKIKRICLEDYLRPYLPEGITLDEALSVSADGSVIVGSGILKTGMHCLWRAYVPEFKSGDTKFGAGEIVSDKLSMKPTQAEAN